MCSSCTFRGRRCTGCGKVVKMTKTNELYVNVRVGAKQSKHKQHRKTTAEHDSTAPRDSTAPQHTTQGSRAPQPAQQGTTTHRAEKTGNAQHAGKSTTARRHHHRVGIQVRIRTNSLEFEFAPISHEFVDRPELELATSNSKSSLIRLIESIGTYNLPSRLQFTCLHMGMPLPSTVSHKGFPKSFRNLAIFVVCCCLHLPC